MTNEKSLPAWRQGWTWTLIKCSLITLVCVALATGGMLWLLRDIIGRLPGWIPSVVLEKIFAWMLAHVWFFGPLVGLGVGALASLGVVTYDARKGRLRKLA